MKYLATLVESGAIGADGPFTAACSELLRSRLGIPQVLMAPSGTAALELAAMLCDLGPGDEVILPSFTFASTANAILRTGARPAFADIRPDTLNLDEGHLEARISSRTKAIFPVHYAGVSCEMDVLMRIARKHNLMVVEDAAHAVGSRYKGTYCGSIGDLGVFSFHSSKDYTCGEGGALCLNSTGISARAEILREKGTDRVRFLRGEVAKYTWLEVGSSYLPSELTSAYLLAQLEAMEQIRAARKAVYERYRDMLSAFEKRECLRLPRVPIECESNYHMFFILLSDQAVRNRLLEHLRKDGIQAAFHYVPLHLSPMGQRLGYEEGQFPRTEDLSRRILRLPLYPDLSEADQSIVVNSLKNFFDASDGKFN